MQGGVGDYTQELGHAMASLGHRVSIITSSAAGKQEARRDCWIMPAVDEWGWSSWHKVLSAISLLAPDVVNIQYQAAAYSMKLPIHVLPLLIRRTDPQIRVVVTYHDLLVPYLFRGAGPLRRWAVDQLARSGHGAILTNEEDARRLGSRLPQVTQRTIPIGSNIAPVRPANYDREEWRRRWGISPHQLTLVYFGFLNQSKGGEDLVEALGQLRERGHDVVLLMVGGKVGASDSTNYAYLSQVEAQIEARELTDRVVWTDFLPQAEVSATLWAADICVLPYRDGVSTRRGTLMAALAHGLPIVTTCPRAPSAHFVDGENLMLVPPASPSDLAHAVQVLAGDDPLRQRVAAGACSLSQRFEWPAIAQETVQFYTALGAGTM